MAKINRDIKQGLLARKDELLKQLKYYEKRIDEVRNKTSSNFHDESSDSEQEFTVHLEPSIAELKLKQSMLQTCLCATQELTSVQILQSEVNVISDPVFERDPPTKEEEGIWREVTVECRIDLVPFSMNFYVHQPKCLFTPFHYKNLQVNPVKSAHEQELAISVLPAVDTPSDAIEVLRNYAKAHRSRRSTLAKLAETYGHTLFMESLPEGGYILKCADVLEVSWTLQNKWSPIAPFHHKMKFDLEYMDESYIKIITQLHRQLSDPSVETDERTLLLSKIINTCLQAKKQTDLTKNESNIDNNINKTKNINNKDSEIMAPPKLIPKKNKKRITDDYSSAKRAKVDNDKENSSNNNNGVDNMSFKQIDKNKAKVNENKCKPISNYYNKEKNSNTQMSNKKLDKNNHLKANEQKKEENTIKADKKLVNKKNKEINNKVTLNSDLKSVGKESTNKQIDKNNEPKTNEQNNDEKTKIDTKEKLKKNNKDKNNHQKRNEHNNDEKTKTDTKEKLMKNNKDKNNHQKTNEQKKEEKAKTDKKEQLIKNNKEENFEPKTNEQNINEIAKTNKNELLHKKNKDKDNLTSNSNSDIKSNNKISTKIIDKNKVDLKGKKGKVEEKKIRKDNKETLNTDKEKNEANIKLNEELSKKNNKSDSKIDKNNCKNKYNTEKDNTKFVTDLKSKNNVISNKEINKNKINNHKTKPKIIINNEKQHKIETKSSHDLKTKNNIIQNKEINRNKIENKTKTGGNKFEIYRNKKKQSNLTNNSNLSNKERNKITSKIPKRIQSMELKKNMLRLSPRFIKKPSVKQ